MSDQLTSLTALNPVQKFSGYVFVATPSSAGGLRCTTLGLPAGSVVKLESLVGATYNDAAPVAYLRYLVKEGGASSRIVIQRVNLDTAIADPVANARSFNEPLALWINGGDVFDVQDNDVHTVSACIQSSTGVFASGPFILTGTYYVTPPAAVPPADSAAKKKSTVEESSESDPTLIIQKRVQPTQPKK